MNTKLIQKSIPVAIHKRELKIWFQNNTLQHSTLQHKHRICTFKYIPLFSFKRIKKGDFWIIQRYYTQQSLQACSGWGKETFFITQRCMPHHLYIKHWCRSNQYDGEQSYLGMKNKSIFCWLLWTSIEYENRRTHFGG